MNETPVVFIPRDNVLDDVLNEIAQCLGENHVRVVRGEMAAPGCHVESACTIPAGLASADVAMLTMRTACTAAMLDGAPNLRGIVYPTIGVESLDLEAADDRGIIVGHGAMPENFLGVAEATVMLMLMLLYNPIACSDVLHGRRARPEPRADAVWSRMMRGRTIGMVGFGRIGKAIAHRLQGWQVRILANDPYIEPASLPVGVEGGDFATVMRQSDIVVVLVAITPQTQGIIDAQALSMMKPDAYLVNVSRGQAIDEVALAQALQQRRIAGAALDVFCIEPLPLTSELRKLDNIFLTPHMIGQTKEVFQAIVPTAVENITRLLAGELPLYCKNPGAQARWRLRLEEIGAQTGAGDKT